MTTVLTPADLMRPILVDPPPQWQTIPVELYNQLIPDRKFYLPEEARLLDRILAADWLLLRNSWHFKCGRCNNVHEYFTAACIERPFNRLSAIWGLIKDKEAEGYGDLILSGMSLGTIEPITRDEAKRLAWKIAFKGYKLKEWSQL